MRCDCALTRPGATVYLVAATAVAAAAAAVQIFGGDTDDAIKLASD